ncbi:MAG TPA: ABC transporter permease [Pyrinomonadaceae bacterium]|nr:ABC transporter permease [Pyrinomonadaceae bacterium]
MTDWTREIRSLVAELNLPPTRESEVVEELVQHTEDHYHDLLLEGLSEAEASTRALDELRRSNVLPELKRVERPAQRAPIALGAEKRNLTLGLGQDLRYAFRMLLKHRVITLVAVVTMAAGIGVNTAVFSTLELLVFRPFDFANQQRLLMVWEQRPEAGLQRGSVAPGNFHDWLTQSQAFTQLVAFASDSFDLSDAGQPERHQGTRVSNGFFTALGAQAAVGRTFAADETQSPDSRVVVLKHSFWQNRFRSDPNIVNQTIRLNGQSFTVIGVMPPSFDFPVDGGELWVPLVLSPQEQSDRSRHYLEVFGLPQPGFTSEQASQDLNSIAARAQREYPETNGDRSVRVVSLVQDATRGVRVGAPFMFLTVLFVWLIACANVTNLLLVRAASQENEIAIRLALGASRFRIVRQLLADSLLLSCLGGALGLVFSVWSIRLWRGIPADFSRFIPGWDQMGIDHRALIFTLVVSVMTGLLCGFAPALAAGKLNLNEVLKDYRRGQGGATSRFDLRRLLVVFEVAISFVLLVGAGVMIRSFAELMRADLGVNPANVLTMQVDLPGDKYANEQSRIEFYGALIRQLRNSPGVLSVGAAGSLPLGYTYHDRELASVGQRVFTPKGLPSIHWRPATPGYFAAIGNSLRKGRLFTEDDRAGGPRVAVVNEAFVRDFLPNREAVGQRFKSSEGQPYEIIGVLADILNDDLEARPEPEVYVPYAQESPRSVYLVIRADANPAALTSAVRRELSALDDQAPVFNVKLMTQIIDERLSPKRMAVYGLGGGALIAVLLAAAGLYSLMSYMVTQRTHEISLRQTLGATTLDILKLMIGRGMKLFVIGAVLGLAGAAALTRLLQQLWFGVSAQDPLTFGLIALLFSLVALAACYLPARRASRVDPAAGLKCE